MLNKEYKNQNKKINKLLKVYNNDGRRKLK